MFARNAIQAVFAIAIAFSGFTSLVDAWNLIPSAPGATGRGGGGIVAGRGARGARGGGGAAPEAAGGPPPAAGPPGGEEHAVPAEHPLPATSSQRLWCPTLPRRPWRRLSRPRRVSDIYGRQTAQVIRCDTPTVWLNLTAENASSSAPIGGWATGMVPGSLLAGPLRNELRIGDVPRIYFMNSRAED